MLNIQYTNDPGHGENWQNSEDKAFKVLIDQYGTALFAFILHLVKNPETARDIYQDTWIRVFQHRKTYQEQGQFKSWLFKIANRICLNHLRRFRRVVNSVIAMFDSKIETDIILQLRCPEPTPDQQLESKELLQQVNQILQTCTIKQQQVLLLRIHSGLTFREISELLHRPLNTVLTQAREALVLIRKRLKEVYEEMPEI